GLAAVGVEHRVRQVVVTSGQRGGQAVRGLVDGEPVPGRVPAGLAEGGHDLLQVFLRGGLVHAETDRELVDGQEVVPAFQSGFDHTGGTGHAHAKGVEVGPVHDLETALCEGVGARGGAGVHLAGDGTQPLGAVVDRVHAGHDGQDHLGGTDVAGGL